MATLQKLARLYEWRYQILSQPILTDRRGPIFHFPARNSEFVTTEIGSSYWVPSAETQDAALQKYGTALPLELRQRLMELGWSEDDTIAGKSDWEQIPISLLPTLQQQADNNANADRSTSPGKSLMRKTSSASGDSITPKRRKAIFSPVLVELINEQASLLAYDGDASVGANSREIVRLLQRDDPVMLLRPITLTFSHDFPGALSALAAVGSVLSPGFAYAALNAIVGYLKYRLRSEDVFPIMLKRSRSSPS